jgi:hypothetical protein
MSLSQVLVRSIAYQSFSVPLDNLVVANPLPLLEEAVLVHRLFEQGVDERGYRQAMVDRRLARHREDRKAEGLP